MSYNEDNLVKHNQKKDQSFQNKNLSTNQTNISKNEKNEQEYQSKSPDLILTEKQRLREKKVAEAKRLNDLEIENKRIKYEEKSKINEEKLVILKIMNLEQIEKFRQNSSRKHDTQLNWLKQLKQLELKRLEKLKLKDQKIDSKLNILAKKRVEYLNQKLGKEKKLMEIKENNIQKNCEQFYKKVDNLIRKHEDKDLKLNLDNISKDESLNYQITKNRERLESTRKRRNELQKIEVKHREEITEKLEVNFERATELHESFKNKPNKNELISIRLFGKTRLINQNYNNISTRVNTEIPNNNNDKSFIIKDKSEFAQDHSIKQSKESTTEQISKYSNKNKDKVNFIGYKNRDKLTLTPKLDSKYTIKFQNENENLNKTNNSFNINSNNNDINNSKQKDRLKTFSNELSNKDQVTSNYHKGLVEVHPYNQSNGRNNDFESRRRNHTTNIKNLDHANDVESELLSMIIQEQKLEEERENILENTESATEKDKLNKIFGFQRAKAAMELHELISKCN